MHDIAEFLRRHAPFDDVADEAIEELARSAEVEFFAAGATIFRQRDEPRKHVWIVRRGAVELVDQGRVLDLLGEGELFGHPSMLSGLPTGFEASAAEDSLCYRLPAEAVVPLLARPAGLRYVARSLIARPWSDASDGASHDPAQQPVARLVHGKPVIVAPTETVRETARRMAAEGASAALVRIEDGRLGIVTDRDLRDRVVAGSIGADAPVAEVMSAPAFTVSPQRFGAEVMIEMLDRDIRHVPVVWPHGEVLGVLSDRELLVAETRTPFSLRKAIGEAEDSAQLRRAAAQLRPAVVALHDSQLPPPQIAAMIAVVADALTRRVARARGRRTRDTAVPARLARAREPRSPGGGALVRLRFGAGLARERRGQPAAPVHGEPRSPGCGRARGEWIRRGPSRRDRCGAALRPLVRIVAEGDTRCGRPP